ncbi:MAG TPA: hypothetical protein VFH71_11480 [Rhodanobacteraceae bacterium]|nr:hypothetical protein [Rhodanobacteraceae bacterium]
MKIALLAAGLLLLGGCVMPPDYVRTEGYYPAGYDQGYYGDGGYYGDDDPGYYGGCVNCGSVSVGIGYGYPGYGYGYGGYGYGYGGYGYGGYPYSGYYRHDHDDHDGHWDHGGADHGDRNHWTGGHDGHSSWGSAPGSGNHEHRDQGDRGDHHRGSWTTKQRDPAINRP